MNPAKKHSGSVFAINDRFFQYEEKERQAAELVAANKELAFQNEEKEKRAAELLIANKELAFQNEEKEKRAAELLIANKELAFQNEEKEKRAAELLIANKELAFQNEEKEKRAAELAIANEELAFQNEEKEKRAIELNTVLNRIDDGFFAVDKNAVVTYWNKRAEILLDAKKEDMMGKNLHEMFAGSRSEIFYESYERAIREQSTINFEGFSQRTNKWFAVSAFGLENGLSVYFKDITDKKQYEIKLTKAIIKTQEDERYEIGGELHDNVCQILVGSLLSLGMMKDSLPPAKIEFFNQCREYISLALAEIRNVSHRLAPAFFNEETLKEAVDRLVDMLNVEKKIKVTLHVDDAVKTSAVSLEIQLNLYRILQEQLKNILKYAKATTIDIIVAIDSNKLKMTVSDNGIGFDTDSVKNGIGFANMKRRTELFSGKMEIRAAVGKGCTIMIDIPLNSNENGMIFMSEPAAGRPQSHANF